MQHAGDLHAEPEKTRVESKHAVLVLRSLFIFGWLVSCHPVKKMSEVVSSAFLAPEGGLWKAKTKQRNR